MTVDASVAALLGAAIGASAGIAGQLLTARFAARNERRRLAIEAGLREWERSVEYAQAHGGTVFPSAYFVYFSAEVLDWIETDRYLTPESWHVLMNRAALVRAAMRDESDRLRQDQRRS